MSHDRKLLPVLTGFILVIPLATNISAKPAPSGLEAIGQAIQQNFTPTSPVAVGVAVIESALTAATPYVKKHIQDRRSGWHLQRSNRGITTQTPIRRVGRQSRVAQRSRYRSASNRSRRASRRSVAQR